MMKRKSKAILLTFFFIPVILFAEHFKVSISYLGFTAVNVTITDKDSILTVNAKASLIASIASNMDNNYISNYVDNYLPVKYKKIIDQGDYFEDRIVEYDRENLLAKRTSKISSKINCVYPIKAGSRDFFSALFYLRKALTKPRGSFFVDANKLIWKVNYEVLEHENIRTKFGRKKAIKVRLNFNNYSGKEKERSDMLTNNLVDENRELIFWFSDDELRLPLKAKFMMKPFAVVWKLRSYSN